MIVLDASAALALLLDLGAETARVEEELRRRDRPLAAPSLLDLEVVQALRRLRRSGEVTAHQSDRAVLDLVSLRLTRYQHELLVRRVWAFRDRLTAYDASYLVLADALGAALVTADRGLLAVAREHIEVVDVSPPVA